MHIKIPILPGLTIKIWTNFYRSGIKHFWGLSFSKAESSVDYPQNKKVTVIPHLNFTIAWCSFFTFYFLCSFSWQKEPKPKAVFAWLKIYCRRAQSPSGRRSSSLVGIAGRPPGIDFFYANQIRPMPEPGPGPGYQSRAWLNALWASPALGLRLTHK